mgnify:CR=1 FL=1
MSGTAEATIPFVHPIYVRSVLDCLNSRGVRPSAVLASAGLTWKNLFDGQRWVDFSVFRRFAAHAIRLSGEPALGLLAGSMLLPYHSPMGIAAVTSERLGDGLQFANRHASLIFRTLDFQIAAEAGWSTLRVSPSRPLCETHLFVMQSIVVAYCRLLEAMLGRPADELRVGLPYPRPSGQDEPSLSYVRRVEFDQGCLWFTLPAPLLSTPSALADEKTFLAASEDCRKMEAELGHADFIHQVRQVLAERLASNPELAELAPDLGVSSRTLVRRLAEAGLNYSDVKDDIRKTHAAWYLHHTELTMEAIASQLGFNDPTNFSRKFKNWYQVPPSQMRKALRSGASQADSR